MKTPYDVIIKPVISEKSMDDAQAKKYTFKWIYSCGYQRF